MATSLKDIKKGDKVIMRLFTGAYCGAKEVEKADANYVYFTTGKGMSKFSKKTGKMVEPAPKNEKFANYIEEYDEKTVKAEDKKRANNLKTKAAAKPAKAEKPEKTSKKKAAEIEEDIEDEDIEDVEEDIEDEEEEEEPEVEEAPVVKKKAKAAKPAPKKSKKVVVDDDDEDFEELD